MNIENFYITKDIKKIGILGKMIIKKKIYKIKVIYLY